MKIRALNFFAFTGIIAAVILSGCTDSSSAKSTSPDTAEQTSEAVTAAVTITASITEREEAETEVSENNEQEYVEVSPNNEFIDFDFIEDYQGTGDIGGLAHKAVEFLMTTDEYAESMEHIDEFTDKEFSDYINGGKIVPKFNTAYPNDYDGNGTAETFIIAARMTVRNFTALLTAGQNCFTVCAACFTKATVFSARSAHRARETLCTTIPPPASTAPLRVLTFP